MYDADLVRGLQSLRHMYDERQEVVTGDASASAQPCCERLAAQKLHRYKGDLEVACGDAMVKQIEQSTDVGMRDLACEVNLLLEPVDGTSFAGRLRPDGLQGDMAAQLEILCFVDGTHAALPDQTHNAEPVAEQLVAAEEWIGPDANGARAGVG